MIKRNLFRNIHWTLTVFSNCGKYLSVHVIQLSVVVRTKYQDSMNYKSCRCDSQTHTKREKSEADLVKNSTENFYKSEKKFPTT